MLSPGIQITNITTPVTSGWPVAFHCYRCRATTIIFHPWAAKPRDGDLFIFEGVCVDHTLRDRHNTEPVYGTTLLPD